MAKLQYFAAIPDGTNWATPFSKSFKMDVHSGGLADLIPVTAGGTALTITFGGTGFVYNAAGDFIDGTVKTVTFTAGNDDLVRLSGLNLSAADALVTVEDNAVLLLIGELGGNDHVMGSNDSDSLAGMNGDDFLFGKAGNDILDGGFGHNTLTGGKGADTFACAATDGDTITDFDASGGLGKQDLIDINGGAFDVAKSGKNALVSFVGGDIVLLGIKRGEIDASDFTTL